MREFFDVFVFCFLFVSHILQNRFTSQQCSDGVKHIFLFSSSCGLFDSIIRMPFVLFVSIDNVVSINGTEQQIKSMIAVTNIIISTANTKLNTSILWKAFNRIENNHYWSSSDHSMSSSSFAQNIYSTHFLNQFINRKNFNFSAIYRTLKNGKMKDLTITANNLIQNKNNLILEQKNGYANDRIADR